MSLPKSIRVGYRDYAVKELERRLAEAENRLGTHSAMLQTIEVRVDAEPSEVADSLLHEVLHAAYQVGNCKPDDSEERLVTALAHQLTQIWRDNPDFIAFMSNNVRSTVR